MVMSMSIDHHPSGYTHCKVVGRRGNRQQEGVKVMPNVHDIESDQISLFSLAFESVSCSCDLIFKSRELCGAIPYIPYVPCVPLSLSLSSPLSSSYGIVTMVSYYVHTCLLAWRWGQRRERKKKKRERRIRRETDKIFARVTLKPSIEIQLLRLLMLVEFPSPSRLSLTDGYRVCAGQKFSRPARHLFFRPAQQQGTTRGTPHNARPPKISRST